MDRASGETTCEETKKMSAEKTLELLKKLKEDPRAKELLDGLKNTAPADDVKNLSGDYRSISLDEMYFLKR